MLRLSRLVGDRPWESDREGKNHDHHTTGDLWLRHEVIEIKRILSIS